MFSDLKRLQVVEDSAATVIQSYWRYVLAWRLRRRLVKEKHNLHLNSAARAIQALWRGIVYRSGDFAIWIPRVHLGISGHALTERLDGARGK